MGGSGRHGQGREGWRCAVKRWEGLEQPRNNTRQAATKTRACGAGAWTAADGRRVVCSTKPPLSAIPPRWPHTPLAGRPPPAHPPARAPHAPAPSPPPTHPPTRGCLVSPRVVRQRAVLEAVEGALAAHRLLAHARHHLRNVDGAALAAALAHDERAVVAVQRVHAHLGVGQRGEEQGVGGGGRAGGQ